MADIYLDNAPIADKRIEHLHAWIATHPNGGEGIISADMWLHGIGLRHVALVSGSRSAAEAMRNAARRAQTAAADLAQQTVQVAMVTFDRSPVDKPADAALLMDRLARIIAECNTVPDVDPAKASRAQSKAAFDALTVIWAIASYGRDPPGQRSEPPK